MLPTQLPQLDSDSGYILNLTMDPIQTLNLMPKMTRNRQFETKIPTYPAPRAAFGAILAGDADAPHMGHTWATQGKSDWGGPSAGVLF